ncbi:hypothetical protein F5144DRAFT_607073 [Chaetomium tenue]|uniref:Uncharacterized protein n=1 Tax=Chaetomium tenue TaxID=1854479 RepID=A0ACB7P1B3_9PEZI|nr:hypothetical protein F5144DRAFT_607073 [Chaetomium globosum]
MPNTSSKLGVFTLLQKRIAARLAPEAAPAAALESMPAELRCQILSHVEDLDDLMALVTASPVFYRQYLLDRKALVVRTTIPTLDDLLVDAYAAYTSDLLYQESSGRYQWRDRRVMDFISNYMALRDETPELIRARCTEEALLDMASFYRSVAQPLVLKFATLLRQALGPRFRVEQLSEFFAIFGAREIQEIICIYTLIESKYEELFAAVRWGGDDGGPPALNLRKECELLSSGQPSP